MKRILILFIAFSTGCSYFKSQPIPATEELRIAVSFDPDLIRNVTLHCGRSVNEFYRNRNFLLAWSDSTGKTAAADSLIAFIASSEGHGLIPADYHLPEIHHHLSLPLSHASAAALDFYLSDAYLTMWQHLRRGRIDPETLTRIDLSVTKQDSAIFSLRTAFVNNTFREELEKQQPAAELYKDLHRALQLSLTENRTDTVSIKKRKQLVVNLERLRWNRERPENYIQVNIPSFRLKIVEKDSVILESSVIVGKPETPTPELKSVVRSFIIYPYWHVPRSIVKEILPHIQEDTLYLRRHNYDVLDAMGNPVKISSIDWASYDAETFPHVLRQREGSENTMGVIKFVFNNNYGVYLHDTNARRLFSKEDRALSHGCIRVRKAVELARYLIRDDYIVSPEDLDQYMQLQHRMEITLPKPIPVLLEYFTCESLNGKVRYYKDIYSKDEPILQALSGAEPVAMIQPVP